MAVDFIRAYHRRLLAIDSGPMNIYRTRWVRYRAAALLATIYAFGILAPAIAFAHADRTSIVHVLTETHGGTLTPHFHHDEEQQEHSGKTGSKAAHHCCGVISLPGLEPSATLSVVQPTLTKILFPCSEPGLSGCGSARLDRPPRRPLPV